MGLWTLAGSWSADNLTDGFVPVHVLVRWDKHWKRLAGALVTADLWKASERDGETGYQFHDWDEFQPTSDTIKRERTAARKRMQERRANRSRSVDVRENVRDMFGRTPAERSPDVLVPDPTRPDQVTTSESDHPSVSSREVAG